MNFDYRFKPVQPLESSSAKIKETSDNLYWKGYKFPVTIKEHGAVTHLDFQKSSNLLAASTSTRIQIYNQTTNELVKSFSKFKDVVYGATFRSDGKLLASGGGEGCVRLFDVAGRIPLRTFEGHQRPVHAVKFCNDNLHLYSASDDKTIKLWDIATEVATAELTGHEDYVRCAYTPLSSQELIVTGSYDHTAKIWDLRNNSPVTSVDHGHPIESVLVFPSGTILLTAGSNHVKVWDILQGGKLLSTLSQHHKTITCMTFNHDNTRLLTAGLDKHVKIYDVSTYKVVHNIDYPAPILSMATSKDDRTLAVGMTDKMLSLKQRRQILKEEILEQAKKDEEAMQKTKQRIRDFDLAQKNDIVISVPKIKEYKKYDMFFRKFEYSKALDFVLKSHKHEEIMGVFSELIRRDGLHRALTGRTDRSIIQILNFVVRNLPTASYASILLDVSNVVIDIYASEILLRSPDVQRAFFNLKNVIRNEIKLQRQMCNLVGCLNAISNIQAN